MAVGPHDAVVVAVVAVVAVVVGPSDTDDVLVLALVLVPGGGLGGVHAHSISRCVVLESGGASRAPVTTDGRGCVRCAPAPAGPVLELPDTVALACTESSAAPRLLVDPMRRNRVTRSLSGADGPVMLV